MPPPLTILLKLNIELCVNEFQKAVHNEVNVIITTYSTASKCIGDLVEEYHERKQRLDYFLVIDETRMLFKHIGLISATADDIKHFACFRDYIIVNPHIDGRYNRNIYDNKLIPDVTEQRTVYSYFFN